MEAMERLHGPARGFMDVTRGSHAATGDTGPDKVATLRVRGQQHGHQ